VGIIHLFVFFLPYSNLHLIGQTGVLQHLFTCYRSAQRGRCLLLSHSQELCPYCEHQKCLKAEEPKHFGWEFHIQYISMFANQKTLCSKDALLPHPSICVSALSVCVESTFREFNKITMTIFTMSGGGGALGPGEALKNRVWPLVESGKLKRLESADGQAGERKQGKRGMERES